MEVCVDSIQSALNGEIGGASRLELCSALSEGGLSPSVGMLDVAKKLIRIPVFCMIRPRSGLDFVYSEYEIEVMVKDIKLFKDHGADGFVFGCLTKEHEVDVKACQKLLQIANPLPVTFHRAFDYVSDPYKALETLIDLNFNRILTSGKADTVEYGVDLIKNLIEKAAGRTIVVPGGGINESNLLSILKTTKATEFHGSAKSVVHNVELTAHKVCCPRSEISLSNSYVPLTYVTDVANVKRLIAIYNVFQSK